MRSVRHIFNFVCAKEMFELILMRPMVSSLLGCLEDVYFGFQKIKDVTSFYSEIRNQIDVWFFCMYQKVLNLSELVQSTE